MRIKDLKVLEDEIEGNMYFNINIDTHINRYNALTFVELAHS